MQIVGSVDRMGQLCTQLLNSSNRLNAHGVTSPAHSQFFDLSLHIKLLVAAPEKVMNPWHYCIACSIAAQIWGAVEGGRVLQAAYLYILARHVLARPDTHMRSYRTGGYTRVFVLRLMRRGLSSLRRSPSYSATGCPSHTRARSVLLTSLIAT